MDEVPEGPKVVLSNADLTDWFEDRLRGAIDNQGVELDANMRAYLVNLLTSFTGQVEALEKPVAIQLVGALEASPRDRFQKLREAGDFCLYLTGFFADSIDRGLLDRSYYCDMGAGAYRRAAGAIGVAGPENPFIGLYQGLAARFRQLVGLINEVSERCFGRDRDVLRLYDRFAATGDQQVAARLQRLGVPIITVPRVLS